jgi:hypothetical protein
MHQHLELRTRALLSCFVVVVSLLCGARASAATFADYRHRVSEAIVLIEQLRSTYNDDDPSSREQNNNSVARIREELPVKEAVTLEAQSVFVDNTWLHDALQDYQKTSNSKLQRADALARIEERLRALDEQLEEMQHRKPAANDKDSDKGRLAEILRRPDFNQPATPQDSALSRLWERFLRWVFSLFPNVKPITPGSSQFISGIAQIIVVLACLIVIAFLIWKFGPRFLSNRRRRKKKTLAARIVLGERLEPDQTSADLLAQAEMLARNGDLRAAIRKAYIALLCELGDRKVVSLAQHKTNRDYLNSVRERTTLYNSMRKLTSSFELHWYGFQPAAESDWLEFRSGYQQALKAGSVR